MAKIIFLFLCLILGMGVLGRGGSDEAASSVFKIQLERV